jgi:hypothetical protein
MAKDADYIDKTKEHQYVESTVNINKKIKYRYSVFMNTKIENTTHNHSLLFFTLSTFWTSTNKNDRHDITEILLKEALNTVTLTPYHFGNIVKPFCKM